MTFSILIALASAVWLLSCAASLLSLYLNLKAGSPRLLAALISSCVALLIGYVGVSRIQLNASETVNGQVQWSINSRWFFLAALVLGAVSLGLTLWNWRKTSSRLAAGPLTRGADGHIGDEPGVTPSGGSSAPAGNSGVTEKPPSLS